MFVHAHAVQQLLNHGGMSLRQDVQNASLNNARHLFLIRFKCLSGACNLSDTNSLGFTGELGQRGLCTE